MKKILKLTAMVFGVLVMIFNLSSCSKDDDNDCCTLDESGTSDDGTTYSYSLKICEDGFYSYSYTYGDETYSRSGDWRDDDEDNDQSWSDIKEEYCS